MRIVSPPSFTKKAVLLAALIAAHLGGSIPVRADAPDVQVSKFLSESGNLIYLGAGTLLPLATDGKAGKTHTLRAFDALITTAIVTYGLKNLTHERRPEGDAHDSFPSGHASAAFAVAAIQSQFHPREAPSGMGALP